MSETKKIILIRSPRGLISKNQIGYGWDKINFSEYDSSKDLIKDGFKKKNINLGRKKNQIERYFNLEKDDLVVVPCAGTIAIARVIGKKTFHDFDDKNWYAENRIEVNYLSGADGNVFIPRSILSTELQSRLKIRMTNADLAHFSKEILKHTSSLDHGEIHTWIKDFGNKENEKIEEFKEKLLDRLKKGEKISIKAGGAGLELLIKEILEIAGYDCNIPAKNERKGIADIDVIATKESTLISEKEGLFIQVKHHQGLSGHTGLDQLIESKIDGEEFPFYRKILISSGQFSEEVKIRAEESNIVLVDGKQLVDWITDNISQLSPETKVSLGVSTAPSFVID